jgi:hypothetical protein
MNQVVQGLMLLNQEPRDGYLSEAEFAVVGWDGIFDLIDTDGDGQITEEELKLDYLHGDIQMRDK